MKMKMTEEQIQKEKDALSELVQSMYNEMDAKEKDECDSMTPADFRASEVGKESVETFLKDTNKIGEPTKSEGEEPDEAGKDRETLYLKNLAAVESVLEAALSVYKMFKESKGECDADAFKESAQGKRAITKYMKEAEKLMAQNVQAEAEEEAKKCEEGEDEDKLNLTQEDEENLDKFTEALASFIKKEQEEEDGDSVKDESEDGEEVDKKNEDDDDPEDETKNESIFRRFAKSEEGRTALKEYAGSLRKVGFRLSEGLDKDLAKVGKQYKSVLVNTIEEAFKSSALMKSGTLNEAQGAELSALVSESVSTMADTVEEKMRAEMVDKCEAYVNAEVIPTIVKTFDEHFVPAFQNEIAENMDRYLEYTAYQIVEELSKGNLIVKSHKAKKLEAFGEKLLDLIKEELAIVPEQEDEVERLVKANEDLRNKITNEKLENVKMTEKILDLRKENYVISKLPETFSEATKEKLLGYAQDVLWEACDNMDDFKEGFDKACDDAAKCEDEFEDKEKQESRLRGKFRKHEGEDEDEPKNEGEDEDGDSGKNEDEEEPKDKQESDDPEKDKMMEAILRLGGLHEEEEPEKDEDEYEDNPDEKLQEKFRRLGKKGKK